ncbi:MAG: class I SAM-dependent DNA methyltransferase [Gammaproteobacteria bacterium]|nr:class I SAM-dependent DNA methyltransferase [Gammaproteobacteria bacterium]MXW45121.1 class I SAM-dependent DNA methyltransferase [Gammaproteobacteria bacterium]MYD01905.1 class I SAM-dependent DNA methyltransferase [Gammaproteobacteria bacterium]MYI26114.1 class I SAM-dependent DNA methyltransferase [Gammaproteobacteria bacterium]
MTPNEFIAKWQAAELKERSAAQEHFIDLCRLLGEPTPAEDDPTGDHYCFERGARKDTGGDGWADVWKRGHFAWEYKGKHANLDKAFQQLRRYALALENPPLLIVSDMARFRITTNWTNSVSAVREFTLAELEDGANRDLLKWAMSDPERLRPGETRQMVTERAAATFSELAQSLRDRGHEPQAVAHFVNRLVFCMFAEDIGLLPDDMFTRMLKQARGQSDEFVMLAQDLFGAMSTGGRIGFEPVAWFNGGLFDDDSALPLDAAEIQTALKAAALDWSEIDPSVLGTLFERGLDPDKRSQLGAHYTDRDKIMRIVDPVIVRPLLAEWEHTKANIESAMERADAAGSPSARSKAHNKAKGTFRAFLERLRTFIVLDPACGSGNFLYLALQALKDIEHKAHIEAEAMGLERGFPAVGPANVKGIELNPYAAELARVSVWIGEIQWMRRNGFSEERDPILKPLDNIECRDAILAPDGSQPDWPQADVVIGNPPFLGGRVMRGGLGHEYTERLRQTYQGAVASSADLVCYWFHKAGGLVAQGKLDRAGLVATNSIRGGDNRPVLDRIVSDCAIFDSWPDEPWVVDGAAVRVSLVCFSALDADLPISLNGLKADHIYANLTDDGIDLTRAIRLATNEMTAFLGVNKNGAFDIPGHLAREWLRLPANPNGRPNADVLKPRIVGKDLVQRSSGQWIIDFGATMTEADSALYEAPFEHVLEHVRPVRATNRVKPLRENWWRHMRPRPAMWRALDGMARCIVTPTLAKHRLFAWLDTSVCPDHQLIVIARDDDTTFGILHSRFHESWSLRQGTSLEDRPRYTPTTTFETFPFPEGLSPDIPADNYANDPRAITIAEAARRLVELRDNWLNPPEWVEWVDEPAPGYPKRPVARDEAAAKQLKSRTLTNLYNAHPQWLADAHSNLDAAVAEAYGWGTDISEDEALAVLLALNQRNTELHAHSATALPTTGDQVV